MWRYLSFLGLCLTALAYLWASPARAFQATASPTPPASAPGTAPQSAAILSPLPGQALQGVVPIVVDTPVEGFEALELAFAYANDPTDTWFPIFQGSQPVTGEALTQWDTGQISDGVYTLRLTVRLVDGSQQTAQAAGLRVRNYTAIESDTPTPVTPSPTLLPQDTPIPSATPTPTGTPRPPTSTSLPPNPAILSRAQVLSSVLQGGLAVVGGFALAGLYGMLRRLRRPPD